MNAIGGIGLSSANVGPATPHRAVAPHREADRDAERHRQQEPDRRATHAHEHVRRQRRPAVSIGRQRPGVRDQLHWTGEPLVVDETAVGRNDPDRDEAEEPQEAKWHPRHLLRPPCHRGARSAACLLARLVLRSMPRIGLHALAHSGGQGRLLHRHRSRANRRDTSGLAPDRTRRRGSSEPATGSASR